jgi:hypothetical protein
LLLERLDLRVLVLLDDLLLLLRGWSGEEPREGRVAALWTFGQQTLKLLLLPCLLTGHVLLDVVIGLEVAARVLPLIVQPNSLSLHLLLLRLLEVGDLEAWLGRDGLLLVCTLVESLRKVGSPVRVTTLGRNSVHLLLDLLGLLFILGVAHYYSRVLLHRLDLLTGLDLRRR